MRRRLALVSLALLLFVLAGVLLVHTPPVRSFALRFAIRAALSQGIQLAAERLDYNLATRNVRLANVTVSAVGDSQPFFVADEVVAAASYRVFFGEVAFDEVSVRNGAVRIVRRADGTSNLPESSGRGVGDPAPIPIARIDAPRLAVEYRDESADIAIRLPALTVDLSARGRISLETPAELSLGSTSTRIETVESDVAFDGRDLRLSGLRLVAPELRARVDGTLALIRGQPSIDVRVSGDTELQNAAKWWGQTDDAIRGGVHLEGTVAGPFGEPSANLQITSNRVSWQRLDIANVSGRARLDGDGLEVGESRALIAGGEVNATGDVVWTGGTCSSEGVMAQR